jgi:hypothetical protein
MSGLGWNGVEMSSLRFSEGNTQGVQQEAVPGISSCSYTDTNDVAAPSKSRASSPLNARKAAVTSSRRHSATTRTPLCKETGTWLDRSMMLLSSSKSPSFIFWYCL